MSHDEEVAALVQGEYTIFGNIVLDIQIENEYEINEEGTVIITTNSGGEIVINTDKKQGKSTDKFTADRDLSELFNGNKNDLNYRVKFGGGGYNSLCEIVRHVENPRKCKYVDIQIPTKEFVRDLERLHISGTEYYFFDKLREREIPINFVLGGRKNKIDVKNPIRKIQKEKFDSIDELVLETLIGNSGGVMINSLKEEWYAKKIASLCKERGKRLVSVLTGSLDPHEASYLAPLGTIISNFDEGGYVFGQNHEIFGNENSRYQEAVQNIKELRVNNELANFYCTLGANGVLVSNSKPLYHIKLKNKKIKDVLDKVIKDRRGSTNGAGDHFAGAVFCYEMSCDSKKKNYDPIEAGILGCISAIEFLYNAEGVSDENKEFLRRKLHEDDFSVEVIT